MPKATFIAFLAAPYGGLRSRGRAPVSTPRRRAGAGKHGPARASVDGRSPALAGQVSELLALAEIARRLDVGPRHIANLVVDGLPRVKNKQGHWRYPATDCFRWYVAYREAKAARRAEPASPEDARQRREVAQARLTELELEREEARMVTIEDVERHVAGLLARLRAKIVTLPSKYAHRMVGATLAEAQARLDEAVEEILGELAGTGEEEAADDEPAGMASAAA
jgi:hypothetical protein